VIRVLVVDDHALFRDGLRALLDTVADLELVGEAASGEEGVARAGELRPDVVLMDLHMPGIGGIAATERLTVTLPDAAVVVLTMVDDDEAVLAAMRAGARGYVLKGADQAELRRVIQAAADGEVLFGPGVAQRLLGLFRRGGLAAQPFPALTDREREILELVAAGRSNADIARTLFLSPKTVRNHVSSIFAKLRVTSRAEAIVRARDAGLGNG
jgi:DNA-binding NarL/FixJ family response regulator